MMIPTVKTSQKEGARKGKDTRPYVSNLINKSSIKYLIVTNEAIDSKDNKEIYFRIFRFQSNCKLQIKIECFKLQLQVLYPKT